MKHLKISLCAFVLMPSFASAIRQMPRQLGEVSIINESDHNVYVAQYVPMTTVPFTRKSDALVRIAMRPEVQVVLSGYERVSKPIRIAPKSTQTINDALVSAPFIASESEDMLMEQLSLYQARSLSPIVKASDEGKVFYGDGPMGSQLRISSGTGVGGQNASTNIFTPYTAE